MDSKPTPPDTRKVQLPMTAEPAGPVTVEPPKHPLHALASYELQNYRRELERALRALPEHATVRKVLQENLAEVLAEQESRAVIADPTAR
jgi:hypothetical protein